MWQTRNDNHVDPLVADPEFSAWPSFFNQMFPHNKDINKYLMSDETKRISSGEFFVATELRKLLSPHAKLINQPDNTNIRVFYFPFKSIKAENSEELNNLHLAKVIVLLQMLANPNLVMNENKLPQPWILLINSLNNGEYGLNALRLLFSYGLSYEKFLVELRFVIKQTLQDKPEVSLLETINSTDEMFEQFLCDNSARTEYLKEEISRCCGIFRPVLDLTKNDPSLITYQDLRQAYRAYRSGDYSDAFTHYRNAYLSLSALKTIGNQNYLITEDYEIRFQKCKNYMRICESLQHTFSGHSLFATLYGCFWHPTPPHQEHEEQKALLGKDKIIPAINH